MTGGTLLTLDIRYEQDVVQTRQRARQIAGMLDVGTHEQTAFATAVSELARNAFQYAGHGRVTFAVQTDEAAPPGRRQMLVVRVHDDGPGVADLAAVLQGRYRSTTGMGLGILGAKRLNDEFEIRSAAGAGTTVTIGKWLPQRSAPVTGQAIAALTLELAKGAPRSPLSQRCRSRTRSCFRRWAPSAAARRRWSS